MWGGDEHLTYSNNNIVRWGGCGDPLYGQMGPFERRLFKFAIWLSLRELTLNHTHCHACHFNWLSSGNGLLSKVDKCCKHNKWKQLYHYLITTQQVKIMSGWCELVNCLTLLHSAQIGFVDMCNKMKTKRA